MTFFRNMMRFRGWFARHFILCFFQCSTISVACSSRGDSCSDLLVSPKEAVLQNYYYNTADKTRRNLLSQYKLCAQTVVRSIHILQNNFLGETQSSSDTSLARDEHAAEIVRTLKKHKLSKMSCRPSRNLHVTEKSDASAKQIS